MVAIKAHQAEQFLKTIDPKIKALLFYGSDVGLISERARGAVKAFASSDGEAGETIRLHDEDIAADPDRLLVELQTLPMFGGRKVVHANMGRRMVGPMTRALSGTIPENNRSENQGSAFLWLRCRAHFRACTGCCESVRQFRR